MARIRLSLRTRAAVPYLRPDDHSGAEWRVPLYRLYTKLVVVPRDATGDYRPADLDHAWCPDAILDTGAPLSLFPYELWEPFATQIRWLEQPQRSDGAARRVTVLGGQFAYRLGRVRVGAIDESGRWLPAGWHNAFFLNYDPSTPREAILGLGSRLLHNRRLRHTDAGPVPEWWLEDA